MKTISLTVFERLQLMGWLNQRQGDLRFLRRAMRVLDALELSEEEREEVGLVEADGMLRWQDQERVFRIELEDADFALLAEAVGGKGWPVNPLILAMLERIEQAG